MEQAPTELPADAWAVIDQYKPRGREPEHVPERINFDLQWLLRFLPRVIPRGEIMDAAFNRAEYNLLRGGPPAPPSNQRHENRCWSVSEAALEEVNRLVVLGSAGYLVGKTLLAKYRRILETQENCEA